MAFFADLASSDGFLRPSSCRRGRWAESGYGTTCYVLQHVRGQQLFHPSVLPRHVDRLLPHYRVRKFVGGGVGGGLTARRKRKSSLLRPPPPLFPESRSQKGGGVTVGQYGTYKWYTHVYIPDHVVSWTNWGEREQAPHLWFQCRFSLWYYNTQHAHIA